MYIDELMDYSERRTREEIRKLPDGEYEFTDYLDDDGFEDRLIPIKLKITSLLATPLPTTSRARPRRLRDR